MLQLAVQAQLPLIAVTTRDTMNLPAVLKEITGKTPVAFVPGSGVKDDTLYMLLWSAIAKEPSILTDLYRKAVTAESTVIVVNPAKVIEPMFDAGEVPVPRKLVKAFIKEVVSSDSKAEELLRGLGGVTLKEAAELGRLTLARDKSLTVQGLVATRKSSFQGAKGLTILETNQGFYEAPEPLQRWVKQEKAYFLTGTDARLIPRGLLFDGQPGTGKTAGAKWVAEHLNVPLYRLDIAATKDKYVGNSEANLLLNLQRADQEEPAVLLIDEIEKVFGDDSESGTATSMLSQLLWWLAEHKSRVLTVMTTNAAKRLPRELYREGRIDETLYFDGLGEFTADVFVKAVLATFEGLTLPPLASAKIVGRAFKTSAIAGTDPPRVSQAALTKAAYTYVKLNAKSP